MKLLVDTNVVVDYLIVREPFFSPARMIALLGSLGEFDLVVSSSQVTDIFYLITNGGKRSLTQRAKHQMKAYFKNASVYALNEYDIDAALDSPWNDFEDACVHQAALKVKADAIITRNQQDFMRSSVKVMSPDELFAYLEEEKGISYAEMPF